VSGAPHRKSVAGVGTGARCRFLLAGRPVEIDLVMGDHPTGIERILFAPELPLAYCRPQAVLKALRRRFCPVAGSTCLHSRAIHSMKLHRRVYPHQAHRRFARSSCSSKVVFEKCGDFCGYTPSKKCEIVGSTHSLRKFGGACNTLIMGDIEQF